MIFTKSVPNEEIQDYYKSADLFVSMHDPEIEGLPMPVLEAMASGIPIITTKPRKFSEDLGDSVIFSEIKPNVLSVKIKEILDNKKLAKSLADRALKKSEDFDGLKTEKREAEIYQELIKGNDQ